VRLRGEIGPQTARVMSRGESSPYTLICYYAPKRFARRSDACVPLWFNKSAQRSRGRVHRCLLVSPGDTEQEYEQEEQEEEVALNRMMNCLRTTCDTLRPKDRRAVKIIGVPQQQAGVRFMEAGARAMRTSCSDP